MKILPVILCFLLMLGGSSCRKKEVSLSGRILLSCDGTPVANETVSFYSVRVGGAKSVRVGEAVTDAQGRFSVTFKALKLRYIMLSVKNLHITQIPHGRLDLGDLYLGRTAGSVVKVKALNAYASANDVLHVEYQSALPGYYSMPTPLHDTVFPVYHQFDNDESKYIKYNDYIAAKQTHTVKWSFVNGLQPAQTTGIDIPFCNAVPDTIYITIE